MSSWRVGEKNIFKGSERRLWTSECNSGIFFFSVRSSKAEKTSIFHSHYGQCSLEAGGWIRQALETDFQDDGKVVHFMFAFNLGIMTSYCKTRSKSHGI